MIKDPLMQWEGDAFPYDALVEAGIKPESPMKQILDAAGDLIEKGLWSQQKRMAWDELRTIERRLWVDFFLYPVEFDDIIKALEYLCDEWKSEHSLPEMSHLLRLNVEDFQRMEQEFQKIKLPLIELQRRSDFDESTDTILERVKFDF